MMSLQSKMLKISVKNDWGKTYWLISFDKRLIRMQSAGVIPRRDLKVKTTLLLDQGVKLIPSPLVLVTMISITKQLGGWTSAFTI